MKRLDSVLDHRSARRRVPALRKILVLPVILALVLLSTLSVAVLPQTSAEATNGLVLPYETDPEPSPKESPPKLARPRVTKTGKDVNGESLVPGDEILWTITVKNVGDKLTKITISDTIPEWTTYVEGSIQGPGANDSGCPTLIWAVDSLKSGERVTVSFRSRVDDNVPGGTVITNQASADSAQTPPGVSDAVTLEVADASELSPEVLSASSSPTTVSDVEGTAGGDASTQTTGPSEVADEADQDSSETTSTSSEDSLQEPTGDDPSQSATTKSDDGKALRLSVGLGVGLGGLALIGAGAGLLKWRRGRMPGK